MVSEAPAASTGGAATGVAATGVAAAGDASADAAGAGTSGAAGVAAPPSGISCVIPAARVVRRVGGGAGNTAAPPSGWVMTPGGRRKCADGDATDHRRVEKGRGWMGAGSTQRRSRKRTHGNKSKAEGKESTRAVVAAGKKCWRSLR